MPHIDAPDRPSWKLLLVEDNADDIALVRRQLAKEASWIVEQVGSLSAALGRLGQGGIEAVILHLGLPDSQGLESVRRIRALCPGTPVVVLTGHSDEECGRKAIQDGAQDYLPKGRLAASALRSCSIMQSSAIGCSRSCERK